MLNISEYFGPVREAFLCKETHSSDDSSDSSHCVCAAREPDKEYFVAWCVVLREEGIGLSDGLLKPFTYRACLWSQKHLDIKANVVSWRRSVYV